MSEPTPAQGDAIPDVVLDELRSAFSGRATDAGALDADVSFTTTTSTTTTGTTTTGTTTGTRATGTRSKPSRRERRGKPPKPPKLPKPPKSSTAGRGGAPVAPPAAAAPPPLLGATAPASPPDPSAGSAPGPKLGRRQRKAAEKLARQIGADLTDTFESVRVLPAERPTTAREDRAAARADRSDARRARKDPPPAADAPARSTIVIGGDDLPDAVYLDEDAEPRLKELYGGPTEGGSGSIVLGNELDSSGAFDAVSPPSRSMDPRVRARRIAVKRAASRKRLIWAGVVLFVLLLIVGALAVVASSLFAVRADDVQITGAVYTDRAALQAIIDEVVGDPVLLVDTQALEDELETLPWVERAAVTADFPHHLGVDLRERLPLATFVGTDGGYRVIDRSGRVLAVLDNQPVAYMLLTGAAPDTEAGAYAGTPYAQAAQLVGALPTEIRNITDSVSVDSATGDLGLLLQPEVPVRLGDFGDIETKLARLLQYMRGDDGISGCTRIDVSTGEVSCATG